MYINDRSDANRDSMVRIRSTYKTCTKTQNMYLIALRPRRFKNARLYWKLLKDAYYVKASNVSLDNLENYTQKKKFSQYLFMPCKLAM